MIDSTPNPLPIGASKFRMFGIERAFRPFALTVDIFAKNGMLPLHITQIAFFHHHYRRASDFLYIIFIFHNSFAHE
ncbi:MAG TPA: hypothetical protein DCE56_15110 [Cyanobacteria bacterium UBA8553]|nr:hypothetical protein [Cyanobacteria bacterium UBA8553]